jgi:lipopolysaccharide export system permease protein
MGWIFYRYLVREQLVPLGICVLGLCVILVTGRMMQLMQYLFASNVTVLDLFELILLTLPKLILFALPMATLIGVLLAFLRLTNDNELLVMRAAGINFSQFLPPVLTVVVLMTSISLYSAVQIMPHANTLFRLKLSSLGRAALPALLKEGTFIDFIPGMTFFFQNVDSSKLTLQGIFLQDQREPRVQSSIVAKRGQILYLQEQDALIIKISDGIITRVQDDFKNAQTISFREYELPFRGDEITKGGPGKSRGRSEMTLGELWETIEQKGVLELREYNRYAMELHQMLALPFGCLVLGLLAPPLGAFFRQAKRMTGLILGLSLFLGYYLLLSAGKGLAENGLLSPAPAIWIPNLVTLALAITLWIRMQRETPIRCWSLVKNSWQALSSKMKGSNG